MLLSLSLRLLAQSNHSKKKNSLFLDLPVNIRLFLRLSIFRDEHVSDNIFLFSTFFLSCYFVSLASQLHRVYMSSQFCGISGKWQKKGKHR